MDISKKIQQHGVLGLVRRVVNSQLKQLHLAGLRYKHRGASAYASPSETELLHIESDLAALDIPVHDYVPDIEAFKRFQSDSWFPADYHGGRDGGAWNEKQLEHWISSERLDLHDFSADDIYVDIAAASSPWARVLRERKELQTYAIDLCEIGEAYKDLPYYRVENATKTTFQDASVRGATLHCAYEMFLDDDDTALIDELARVLAPGGKVIVLPLYMHTHYCAYSTPDYFGTGRSDPAATEYIQPGFSGIPSSRKYDAATLKQRVLDPILATGMNYRLLAIRNKQALGQDIYCHFILEIER